MVSIHHGVFLVHSSSLLEHMHLTRFIDQMTFLVDMFAVPGCRLCGLIVRVRVVPRRTVVGGIDRRFDNLSGSHHQSHVNCVSSVYGIFVSGQLSHDVIGCWLVKSCCYLL